jgi:hypothetical protein
MDEKIITLPNFFLVVFLYLKTDTASVLHEATEYIKFLHDQVAVSIIEQNYTLSFYCELKDLKFSNRVP